MTTNRIDQESPMYFIDYQSQGQIPSIIRFLDATIIPFSIYLHGQAITFTQNIEKDAFVNGLESIYNILNEI